MLSGVLSNVTFGALKRAFFKRPQPRDPNDILAARHDPLHSMQINISVTMGKEPWWWACNSRGDKKATDCASGSEMALKMSVKVVSWATRLGIDDRPSLMYRSSQWDIRERLIIKTHRSPSVMSNARRTEPRSIDSTSHAADEGEQT